MGILQAEASEARADGRCTTCGATDRRDQDAGSTAESPTLGDLLATLPVLAAEAKSADRRLRERVVLLKDRRATWAEIGSALNVTRQAAWERFGRRSR